MAGKGGLNITHSEPLECFLARYGSRQAQLKPLLEKFGPDSLRAWVHGLGIETFIGTSGRVFPAEMKAAPLLRAWLNRLRKSGVIFHLRHRWMGWTNEVLNSKNISLCFEVEKEGRIVGADAVVLALGGGSWARLGSNGEWVPLLRQHGIEVASLRPSNCGFDVGWTDYFSNKFAGHPLKAVSAQFIDAAGEVHQRTGDLMITAGGIEGGLIYSLSALLRDEIAAKGSATIQLDLAPAKSFSRVHAEVDHPRGSRSMSSHLQSRAKIKGVKTGLLREVLSSDDFAYPERLAAAIKSLPLKLIATRPLDEAISSAGGVTFDAMDEQMMLRAMPGIFCAGEMLDWEAPTGGYLLTACISSGHYVGLGVLAWLKKRFTA
jgi:uncharacterized flavoprotein (TIGR03862 family)